MANSEVYYQAELGELYESIARDQSEWSQATFGADKKRGPIGALKHLAKEAQECIDKPNDELEYADCFLLILDASRRAGIGFIDLLKAAQKKMEINKSRAWPKPVDDTPVEHVRT